MEVAATVESEVENSIRNQILYGAIMELKVEYRTLLQKYYLEEKSYKEISIELGISGQIIAQRLARARKKLWGQFSRKWGEEGE
ncbi:sigma-70 family RNA polymerase sigma factor [Paenibacillus sp. SYP-B4298]|uniref:sigma-70 family RNA polymerase sigma factor n=1 Tax=Paenibacillus sp. SYP-B4298 TaxID=2996034 RepID=UPI0022DE0C58|nr:sigma-70 family RNA polymerase sigma factor [Paenibacillus sp. SYP-B4298]